MVSRYKDFFLQFFSQQVYNVSANGFFKSIDPNWLCGEISISLFDHLTYR